MSLSVLLCNTNNISPKLTMWMSQTNSEILKIIRKKIKEDDSNQTECLEHLKDWLRKSPHLPHDQIDEETLLAFLRGCKYSLEKSKKKLDMYYTVRTLFPQYFTNRDITRPELQDLLKDVIGLILPSISPEGYRIGILKGPDENAKAPEIADVIKLIFMIGDMRLKYDYVAGDVYIIDASTCKVKHAAKLTPTLLRDLVKVGLQSYPVKVKAIHIINIASWIQNLYSALSLIIPIKIRNRIHFHSDVTGLYEHLPKEILPKEYGGEVASIYDLHDEWKRAFKDHISWFKEQENVKSNEALRQDKSVNFDEIFGVEGSFRKLTID